MPTAALSSLAMVVSSLYLPACGRYRLAGLIYILGLHNQSDATGRLVKNINNIL
jgi:hypothetical protein